MVIKQKEILEKNKAASMSYMTQKIIVDKNTTKVSEFIVFSNDDLTVNDLTVNDWIYKPKFSEIVDKVSDKPVDYQLKRTVKGNLDEGSNPQSGKALRLSVSDDIVNITIYTQVHGESWTLSHTHTIDKAIFDAYALVIKNDAEVAEKEKENKAPENFTLNLG